MVREDLVNSAVSFLQDPAVANAPVEKRVEFLQSKNLTQEEVDLAIAQAGGQVASAPPAQPQNSPSSSYPYRPPPPAGYGTYPPPGYWQQPPPPEVPRRDWRDWFIMATVMGGVGYGLYFTAKRYIMPLIAPPTAAQLEQDKNSVDAQFDRAFSLIDQLASDTASLKASEEARTQRLDSALGELEAVIGSLKSSSQRRDDDHRRIEDDVRGLRDLIPRAMEAHKETTDARLKDIGTELKSLKTLVGNRMGTPAAAPQSRASAPSPSPSTRAGQGATPVVNGVSSAGGSSSGAAPAVAPPSPPTTNGTTTDAPDAPESVPEQPQASSPYGGFMRRSAAIPAWQMAAAKKSQAEGGEKKAATAAAESGTVVDASPAES